MSLVAEIGNNVGVAVTTLNATVTAAQPAGSFIVVVQTFNGSAAVPTMADSGSNTWTKVTAVLSTTTVRSIVAWWAILKAPWTTSSTVTGATGATSVTQLLDIVAVPAGVGIGALATATGTSTAPATTSLAAVRAGSTVLNHIIGQTSAVTLTHGTGYTALTDFTAANTNESYLHGQYLQGSVGGTVATGATLSSSQQWGELAYEVKIAPNYPPVVVPRQAVVRASTR